VTRSVPGPDRIREPYPADCPCQGPGTRRVGASIVSFRWIGSEAELAPFLQAHAERKLPGVEITPPEPERSADSLDTWKKLLALKLPTAPPPATEIDNAAKEFNVYTSHALELEAAINRGEAIPDDKIGNALDNARAWAEYFGPNGPLHQGSPASTAAQGYVDALARMSQQQRIAQQWVDYFMPLWEVRSSSRNELARDERQCLQRAAQAEQTLSQRQMSYALSANSISSQQIQGYIQELNNLSAEVNTWIAAARGTACRQRLQEVIQKITSALETFRFSYNSRASYENFWRQRGQLPPVGGGMPTGRPGPGSPEWTAASMGLNCYWCGFYLNRSLARGQICPNCGRFPQPGPPMSR
jgi:hypothetical protein